MPSMTDDDDDPFDVRRTACAGMGVTADTFWRSPGALRSDNPHAFAAAGLHAAAITRPHPIDAPHGVESPVGRVYDLDGWILLLGVGHDANTTVHLAENMAGVRYGLPKHATVLEHGRAVRYNYREVDHCCENFRLLDEWLGPKQRRGTVGYAEARLMRARDVIEAATMRLRSNETVFLHPRGVCTECDEARNSMEATSD